MLKWTNRRKKGSEEEEYPLAGAERGDGWCKSPEGRGEGRLGAAERKCPAGCPRYGPECGSSPEFRWNRGSISALSRCGSGRFIFPLSGQTIF